MSGADCTPYFLESPQGGLFAVHHRPAGSMTPLGNMLCVAPFNEEMNRCRSMITLQARAWAALGWGTLLIDLHGTGDSAGEYVDARWSLWRQNLDAAWQWLERQPGGCRGVWGLRLGAILASELHASHGDASVRLLLWQPVLDGKTHLTQFMRVKIAAQIDRPDLPKATTNGMRAQLAAGESIEIAGYEIHPELAQAIDLAKLADHRPAAGTPVMWIENAAPEQAELAPASRALLEKWSAADVRVSSMACAGPAFWQVHERVLTPSFIDASTAWLAKFPDSARAAA